MLRGTDISAWQASAVPSGDFVIIKATQGRNSVNSKLQAQLADARRKHMLVGFYHYPDFDDDPLDDALHFCSVVAPLLQPGDIIVLDHEAADPQPGASRASAWGRTFLPFTEKQCARRPWLYSNVSWASDGHCAGMGAYPYWCADPSSSVGHPRVRGPFKTWAAHQYSEVGGVDHDVFNGSAADWIALGQPQQEDDMAQVSSLGVDGKQVVPAGKNADVKFATEYSDKHQLHGPGATSVVTTNASYWVIADALFELHGLTPGARLDVAWTRVKDDGTFIDDPWRRSFTADEAGVIRDELGGQFGVDAASKLRLRVYNGSDKDVTVQGCLAKVSLFRY